MQCIDFKPDHLDLINLRQYEKDTLDLGAVIGTCFPNQSSTFICDGRIVAICGYIWVIPGVAYIFVIPSIYVRQYAKGLIKELLRYRKEMEAELTIHRMQSFSVADSETDRWMKCLGFKWEGTLRKYIGNKDYNMWGRIVGED